MLRHGERIATSRKATMRAPALLLALGAAALAGGPAAADAPPRDMAKRPVLNRPVLAPLAPDSGHAMRVHRVHRRPHSVRAAIAAVGPGYGPEPPYFPGMGGASPNAGFGNALPVQVTLYREAYIGRGLIYNTPPEPQGQASYAHSNVISVRY